MSRTHTQKRRLTRPRPTCQGCGAELRQSQARSGFCRDCLDNAAEVWTDAIMAEKAVRS